MSEGWGGLKSLFTKSEATGTGSASNSPGGGEASKKAGGGGGLFGGLTSVLQSSVSVVQKAWADTQEEEDDDNKDGNGEDAVEEEPLVLPDPKIVEREANGKFMAGASMEHARIDACSTSSSASSESSPVGGGEDGEGEGGEEEEGTISSGSNKDVLHAWYPCDASTFSMRVGPNYSFTKQKAPSSQALYESVGLDLYRSDAKVDHIATHLNIPPEWLAMDSHQEGVPSLLVVNVQMPWITSENTSLSSFLTEVKDGPGWSAIFYFRMSQVSGTLYNYYYFFASVFLFLYLIKCENKTLKEKDLKYICVVRLKNAIPIFFHLPIFYYVSKLKKTN